MDRPRYDDLLQRGRARESAEGNRLVPEKQRAYLLQRGRARESAEGEDGLPVSPATSSASTGPRS